MPDQTAYQPEPGERTTAAPWAPSKLLRDAHVVSATRTELRCEDADAAAATDLVDGVEHVDDIEPHGDRLVADAPTRQWFEFMRYAEIELPIRRQVVRIGEAG